jgi:hypothetical protein
MRHLDSGVPRSFVPFVLLASLVALILTPGAAAAACA